MQKKMPKIPKPTEKGASGVTNVISTCVRIGEKMNAQYEKSKDVSDAAVAIKAYRNAIWAVRCQLIYKISSGKKFSIPFLEK